MTSVTLAIEGMHCNGCVRSVTNAIKRVIGVNEATVSLPENSATVLFDDSITTSDDLLKAIEKAGYEVKQ